MEQPINEIILKLTGGVTLLEDVNWQDVEHEIKGIVNIYSSTLSDNNDGTVNKIYKAKFVRGIEFGSMEKKVPVKDKGSNSRKLRAMIYHLWQEGDMKLDEEAFYDKFMSKLMANFDNVCEYLKSIK